MNTLKEYILYSKLFLSDYWNLEIKHRLEKPTQKEKELIASLRKDIKHVESSSVGSSWKKFSKRLKRYIKYFDPRNFLHWEIIQLTMTMNDTPPGSLDIMMDSPEWETGFKDAVVEHPFGSPHTHPVLNQSSGTLLVHAWHVFNLIQQTQIKFEELDLIVEFGGGYGNMLKFVRKLGFKGNYIIYDLPEFSLLQNFYLQNVGLKTIRNTYNKDTQGQNILVDNIDIFADVIKNIPSKDTLCIATWSLSETPISVRDNFFKIRNTYNYYLFGYQDMFDGINNEIYFDTFMNSHADVQWTKRDNFWKGKYVFGKT